MPSPIAHAVIGATLGFAWEVPPAARLRRLAESSRRRIGLLLFAGLYANAPDLDYLPGLLGGALNAYHHYYTHTLGWVLLAAAGTWLCARALRPDISSKFALFLLLLLGSHLFADWLTEDTSPPFGLMLFWPLSDRYFVASRAFFPRWEKADLGQLFQVYNLRAAALELVRLMPFPIAVILFKRLRGSFS